MSDRFNDAFGQFQSDVAKQTPAPPIDMITRAARRRHNTRLAAAATAVVVLAGSMGWVAVTGGGPMTAEPIGQPTWPSTLEPAPVQTPVPSDDVRDGRTPESPEADTGPPEAGTVNPDGLDSRCLTGHALCIDKSTNLLHWVVDGEIKYRVAVRFGCADTPTREGEFDVYFKSRDHVSSLHDSEMLFAMFFDGGQAVHYSAEFAAVGYDGCSQGTVNTRDEDMTGLLFDEVNIGDKVIVYAPE